MAINVILLEDGGFLKLVHYKRWWGKAVGQPQGHERVQKNVTE